MVRTLFNINISVNTVLLEVVKEAQKTIYRKQFAITAFLDIEGDLKNVTLDDILERCNLNKFRC